MPIANQTNAKDFYSYKDWGQKLFDATSAALDTAGMVKNGGFGSMSGSGFQNLGQAYGNSFKSMFTNPNATATTGTAGIGGANVMAPGGSLDTGPYSLGSFNFNGGLTTYGTFSPSAKPQGNQIAYTPNFSIHGIGNNNNALNATNAVVAGNTGNKATTATTNPGTATASQSVTANTPNFPISPTAYSTGVQADDDGSAGYKASAIMEGIGGMSNAISQGNFGSMINAGNQATVKAIGNQFRDEGQRIAYGNSTYAAPSRRDLNRQTKNYVNALGNEAFYSNANNYDDLANELNQNGLYHTVSKDITGKQKALAIGQRTLNASGKGAAIGEKIGGLAGNNPYTKAIGSIIGGVAGAVAGAFGGAFGAKKSRERLRKIQAAQNYANMSRAQQTQDAVSNLNQRNLNSYYSTAMDRGGLIETVLHNHRFANGGQMKTSLPYWLRPWQN